MMREIKFRAWFAKERKTVDVKQIDFFGGRMRKTHATIHAETDFEKGGWYSKLRESTNRNTSLPNSNEQIKRVNLMQYTGMTDIEGNEIYEGDIVQALYNTDCQSSFKGNVIFRDGAFLLEDDKGMVELLYNLKEYCTLEVVGNVHEE